MEKEIWKDAFRKLEMTEEIKWQVWENVVRKAADRRGKTTKTEKKRFSPGRWVAAAVAFSFFLGLAVFQIRTEGKFVKMLQQIWKIDDASRKVVEHTASYHFHTLDAPDLIDCSEKRLIFASSMGLIVYDRELKKVTGTIDLKKIGCFYLVEEADQSVFTHFLTEGDRLIIYNYRLDGKKQESCYIYNLAECNSLKDEEIKALKIQETGPVTDSLEKKWKKKRGKSGIKTIQSNVFGDEINGLLEKERAFYYSAHTVAWSAEKGDRYISCLIANIAKSGDNQSGKDEYQFVLYNKNRDTAVIEKEVLELKAYMPESKRESLPAYKCKSDDAIRKALADCAENDLTTFYGSYYHVGKMIDQEELRLKNTPILPIIDIYQIKRGKKYTKVYGDFTTLELTRYGDTLCEVNSDGAGGYGCAYLKKTVEGYRVEKVVHPRDGAYLVKDMQAMCGGNEKIYAKVSQMHQKCWELRQREVIKTVKEYISDCGLDAQYYKGEGENLVELQ